MKHSEPCQRLAPEILNMGWWMVTKPMTDWREMHRPSETNPVCECAGEYVCCPCTLRGVLEEMHRLRASHAQLLEALRAILDDPQAGINITLIARTAVTAAEGGGDG